jgi:uridine phosphorylase
MEKINRAHAPQAENEGVYHLQLKQGDLPRYVLLPGAPERTELLGKQWDEARVLANNREYRTVSGTYRGLPLAAVSTGIGAASSEICIHELHTIGVDTCIRVGSTGSIVPEFDLGDLIIVTAAVRRDGTSDLYIDPAYPAVADVSIVNALRQACESLGFRYGLGIAYTSSSFYIGQARPLGEGDDTYWPSHADHLIRDLAHTGVTNFEMEAAGQFVIGGLHGMRMGAILSVMANRVTDRWGDNGGEERCCLAATEALKILAEEDARPRSRFRIR